MRLAVERKIYHEKIRKDTEIEKRG